MLWYVEARSISQTSKLRLCKNASIVYDTEMILRQKIREPFCTIALAKRKTKEGIRECRDGNLTGKGDTEPKYISCSSTVIYVGLGEVQARNEKTLHDLMICNYCLRAGIIGHVLESRHLGCGIESRKRRQRQVGSH